MPRIFRQSPLNGIWEGSGNVIALDLLRALGREPEAREALLAEIRDAAGEGRLAALAREAEQLTSPAAPEGQARHVIERLALIFAAAVLARHAPAAVADGFLARRVEAASVTFGAGDAAVDSDALIERLSLQL